MRKDVLGQTLEALKLRGTVYFKATFEPPWGMAVPARDVSFFHVVAAGSCWLRQPGAEPRRLEAGDVVLYPQGHAHELAAPAGAAIEPADRLLGRSGEQRCDDRAAERDGATTLVCGHFACDRSTLHPFFRTLPDVVHLSTSRSEHSAWLTTAAELAAAETTSGRPGASAVVDRLAEALLVQTLRLYLERSAAPRGFVAALADPAIGRALAALHAAPERGWTLAELAREARLSRSALAQRFRERVGEAPMQYLARWRMLRARDLLADPALATAEVARRVGYESEFAFARAFKRTFGRGPGAVRREAAS